MNLLYANDRAGAYPTSWYAATAAQLARFPKLKGDEKADVCVVGGGYTGLSAALHLAKAGRDVILLEAQRVGFGASGRNGGQLGSGQRMEQDGLEKLVGDDDARHLWTLAEDAKDLVKGLIAQHNIACHLKPGVAVAASHAADCKDLHGYARHLQDRYGYDQIDVLDAEAFHDLCPSPDYLGGYLDRGAAHLHPLNYARGLAKAAVKAGAEIFELSRVTSVAGGPPCTVKLENAVIKADHVLLCANGYLGNLDKQVADRVMPINNFIIATQPLDDATCKSLIRDGEAVHDSRFVVNYFRISEDNRMLFGGGENYSYKFPSSIENTVRPCMLKIYPQLKDARIDYAWGGTLAITVNRLPHLDFRKDGIVNLSGYSGSGVHMATMSGKIVAEAVSGQMAKFDIMSQLPTPKFPGGATLRWPLLPLALTWYAMRDRL